MAFEAPIFEKHSTRYVIFCEYQKNSETFENTFLDDVYLLQFLRAKKYNMSRAFETVENYYLSRRTCPEITKFNDKLMGKALDLCKSGYAYPLSGRDQEGRKIILIQSGRLDIEAFEEADIARALHLIGAIILEEEETQISGFSIICDLANIKFNQIGSQKFFQDSMRLLENSCPIRIQRFYIVNVPPLGTFLFQLFRSLLSQKLQERVLVLKNHSELKTHIDYAILPKHMDGIILENEIIEDFLKLQDKHFENVRKTLDFEVDWSLVPIAKLNGERESIGSFRKLELD